MILNIDFNLLLGAEHFDRRRDLQSSDFKVGIKQFINDLLIGVVLEHSGHLANLVHLQRRQLNLVLLNKQVRP